MGVASTVQIPLSPNDVPIPALSPIGPHALAPAQAVDNTKAWVFKVPEGVIVRLSCSQDLNVRVARNGDAAPTAAQVQQAGYIKAGASLVVRSLGVIYVVGSSTAVTWAPDVLVGSETDD